MAHFVALHTNLFGDKDNGLKDLAGLLRRKQGSLSQKKAAQFWRHSVKSTCYEKPLLSTFNTPMGLDLRVQGRFVLVGRAYGRGTDGGRLTGLGVMLNRAYGPGSFDAGLRTQCVEAGLQARDAA